MASPGSQVEVRYLDAYGEWLRSPLADVDAGAVVLGRPVRSFPSYRNQANYPGWLWLADFDPTVSGIASQPLWMSGRDGTPTGSPVLADAAYREARANGG